MLNEFVVSEILHLWIYQEELLHIYLRIQWWLNFNLRRGRKLGDIGEMKSKAESGAQHSVYLLEIQFYCYLFNSRQKVNFTSNFLTLRASFFFEIERFIVTFPCQENWKISRKEIANVRVYWDLVTLLYISYISSTVVELLMLFPIVLTKSSTQSNYVCWKIEHCYDQSNNYG